MTNFQAKSNMLLVPDNITATEELEQKREFWRRMIDLINVVKEQRDLRTICEALIYVLKTIQHEDQVSYLLSKWISPDLIQDLIGLEYGIFAIQAAHDFDEKPEEWAQMFNEKCLSVLDVIISRIDRNKQYHESVFWKWSYFIGCIRELWQKWISKLLLPA